ncbi:MAG: hypothetical protein JWQ57_563 [Mucilaginibacter sp.]|nr:hypothetical protein [Mucilaginibacter sp.]
MIQRQLSAYFKVLLIIIYVIIFIFPTALWAQQHTDTVKVASHSDTTVNIKPLTGFNSKSISLDHADSALKQTSAHLKQPVSSYGKTTGSLKPALPAIKKKQAGVELSFENAIRYNPISNVTGINYNGRFADVFSITGKANLGGIPLNINYAAGRMSPIGNNGFNNNLFKFGFDPARLKNMLDNDLLKYNDFRKNVFGGLDLTGYTQKTLHDQLIKVNSLDVTPHDKALAKYLDNPRLINQLLVMNERDMRDKLNTDLVEEKVVGSVKSKELSVANGISTKIGTGYDRQQRYLKGLNDLSLNDTLRSYLTDPANVVALHNQNETQIAEKIQSFDKSKITYSATSPAFDMMVPVEGFKLNAMVDNQLNESQKSHDEVIKQTAHQLFLSVRQNNKANLDTIIAQQRQAINKGSENGLPTDLAGLKNAGSPDNLEGLASSKVSASPGQVDSIATAITRVKEQLAKKGVDAKNMLQMQQVLNDGDLNRSELGSNYLAPQAANGMQSIFNNVQALKAGSFGNDVPGNMQNADMFMNGGHISYNAGGFPITAGYGTVNDINGIKDAGFSNSVYNQARSVTYLSAELKKARGGSLKLSVVSSFNKGISNNLYSIPTISSNNVAYTLSKGFNLSSLGTIGVDVSKTTTLYDNKFQGGAVAVLDRKNGLTSNLQNDLFSSLAFGVKQQLNIKDIGVSDNLYFNYAGMGYQNPADNGFGGAKMKFGGNVKKAFMRNKLNMSLRSDISNMPISYTSDDKWKSFQIQFDSRYQFSKKFNLSFNYTSSATDKKVDNITSSVYSFQKVQLSGNASYKIGKNYSVSHFSVGEQGFSNINALQGAGNLLMVNYTQTLIMRKNVITASLFYNKELSAYHLIGNMLNSDVAYQYTLFGKLNMSSGLTYFNNTGIASQAGVRQGIQLYTTGSFDMDTYVDYRKNLIRSLYPDLYPACRAELSLKYHFKI